MNLPWIEKYRPQKLDDIIAHQDIIKSLKYFIQTSSLPHILFYGPPGTGKTSMIMTTIKELYGDDAYTMVLDLNASEERGIDIVRVRIKKFVTTQNVFSQNKTNNFKIVILDEIDSMTDDAQCILRKIIEENTKNARFCLICNYINKINIALRSRCIGFQFRPLNNKDITEKINFVITNENINITKDGINTIIKRSNGDMRKILNILQSTVLLNKKITSDVINECIGYPKQSEINDIIQTLLSDQNKLAIRDYLVNYIQSNSLSITDIISEIHDYFFCNITQLSEKFSNAKLINIFTKLRYLDINLSYNTNSLLIISALTYIFI